MLTEDFFCVEPVSHCTDALNRTALGEPGTGMQVLALGVSLAVTLILTPENPA